MFKYPELFCSAVPISGGYQHEKYIQEHSGRSQVPPDRVFEPDNNTYDRARRYAAKTRFRIAIMVVVGTDDENYSPNLEWMDHVTVLGIQHRNIIVDGVGHNRPRLYERVGLQIMRFHSDNFRLSVRG
jgi:endo-1,4-beta-xylanase